MQLIRLKRSVNSFKEMSTAHPKVVACLPCYNAETFIERTLRCLKKQTYPNFSVIISDDGSTDNTVSVIKSFISDDDRFLLIQQKKNLGWIDNVDFLLDKASDHGKYTFIMPHDDQIENNYIEKLTASLEMNPTAVLAFSDLKFYHSGNSVVIRYTIQQGVTGRKKRLKLLLQRKQMWWTGYRGMIKSDVVKKIIPSQKNIFGSEDYSADWYLLIRLAMYGEFIRVPEVLYKKYFYQNNVSLRHQRSLINYFATFVTAFFMMFRSPISWREMITFQWVILKQVLGYMFEQSGAYTFFRNLKS